MLLAAGPIVPQGLADSAPDVQISRFSGKPVPRFESLKFSKVNGRPGPGKEYPAKWVYTRKGLPMLILKETQDWYFVQDPSGEKVWISASQLSEAPMALTLGEFILKSGRAADSPDVARIDKDVLVELGLCEENMCPVRAGKYRGWAPRAKLWGATATGS